MVNTSKIKTGIYSEGMTSIGEPTEKDKEFINKLFTEMAGIFPAWKQAFSDIEGTRAAKRNWMSGLIGSGINSMDQIQTGLRKARKSENPFMPSVGQFISWCKPDPEELGLPSVEKIINEILDRRRATFGGYEKKEYSHGIVFAITQYSEFDSFYLSGLTTEKAIKYMQPIYDKYMKQAMSGKEFEIPVMLEDKKDMPVTNKERKEFAEKHLAGLRRAVK